jgi:PBP1b-binding outer membrane lipoprotein LpoB
LRRIALALALTLALGACSSGEDTEGSEAFCEATRKVIDLGNVQELPPEVNTMVEEAPDEIRDSAETIRDSFVEMFDNQDPRAIETDEFQAAAREVREYATENCEGVIDITE